MGFFEYIVAVISIAAMCVAFVAMLLAPFFLLPEAEEEENKKRQRVHEASRMFDARIPGL